MTSRLSFLSVFAASFAFCNLAHAVVIPVQYQQTSWVVDNAPIAISTGPTGNATNVGQNMDDQRIPAQSFKTLDAFTLDKIWIKYYDLKPGSELYTFELRLFEMPTQPGANLPVSPVNLFSEPQIHNVPASAPNAAGTLGNYAIFDVEDIDLKADTNYAFLFAITGSNTANYAYRWMQFSTNAYANGAFYRGDLSLSPVTPAQDQVFALQFALPSLPEPTTVAMIAMGLLPLMRRRRE